MLFCADWADEYALFDTRHDVALSAQAAESEYDEYGDEYSDERWRGDSAREGPPADEASEQDEAEAETEAAEEETPQAGRRGGMARTASPPWLREALRRGREETTAPPPPADVSTVSERGSEARAEDVADASP